MDVAGHGAERAADKIVAAGGSATAHACDVGDPDDVTRTASCIVKLGHAADVRVSCALILAIGSVIETTEDNFKTVLQINLLGMFRWIRAVLPGVDEQGHGSVGDDRLLIVVARLGLQLDGGSPGYSHRRRRCRRSPASCLRPRWRRVIVNCLAAGVVSTPMHSSKLDAIATLTDAVPLRRLAEPVDVLGSVLFLAGDASAYMTGQTIDVNGAHITID